MTVLTLRWPAVQKACIWGRALCPSCRSANCCQLLPPEVFIGWSVETLADVSRSATLPVDYLGVSPIYATPTKSDAATPWGLEGLRQVRAATALPLVAIGGIHMGNVAELLQAGADGLAVVSALCAASDPREAAATLSAVMRTVPARTLPGSP